MKRIKTVVLLGIISILLFSCATGSYAKIDADVAQNDYSSAVADLEHQKKKLYDKNSVILYYLDAGMLNHYADNYGDSIKLLQSGDRQIEEAYTKSISRQVASLIANDKVKNYDGEDYENIYISAFNALNYYHASTLDEAAVEIRRMNEKLAALSDKYRDLAAALQAAADKNEPEEIQPDLFESKFANSALGRYLGMLFYRAIDKNDDARIDRDWLKAAYQNAPEMYPFSPPVSIDEELAVPQGKARLNIIAFTGLCPVKREIVTYIPLGSGHFVKIALPELQYRGSNVTRIEVIFDDGAVIPVEKLEDIQAVTRETFNAKVNLIKLKTTLRATIKGVSTKVVSEVGRNLQDSDDSNVSMVGFILSLGGLIGNWIGNAVEQADIRASRYFPAYASVAGVTLDPGDYSFTVNFYNAAGALLYSVPKRNLKITAGGLNLVEAVYLH